MLILQAIQATIKVQLEHSIQPLTCTNNSQIQPTKIKSIAHINNKIWQWEIDNQSNNLSHHQE